MQEDKTNAQPAPVKDNRANLQKEEDALSNEQLEKVSGGTAVPVRKLEDVDNQTIDRPEDVSTT